MARTKKYINASIPRWAGWSARKSPLVIWDVIGKRERPSGDGLFLFLLGSLDQPARYLAEGLNRVSKHCKISNWSFGHPTLRASPRFPSTKLQTNLKFQYQMTKTGLEFWSLLFVWYLWFVIWNFFSSNSPVLHYSSSPDVSWIVVARPWRGMCHRATAGGWTCGVLKQYVARSDTRGRPGGQSYPRSQQMIREISGLI